MDTIIVEVEKLKLLFFLKVVLRFELRLLGSKPNVLTTRLYDLVCPPRGSNPRPYG